MFDDEDDFDVKDVDFSCFYNQDENEPHSNASSPLRKVPKKHELDFVQSIIETNSENQAPTPNSSIQRHSNALPLSKSSYQESPRNAQVSKRKFPGPAGLLPERPDRVFQNVSYEGNNVSGNFTRQESEMELASSQYDNIFETIGWKCAMQDIQQSGFKGIQNCSISHLKRAAFSSKSKALKYPLLVAVVSNMDTGQELLTLKDTSGNIQAYINSEVLEQCPQDLTRGCVVMLRKVGVLKSGQGRGVYLLVTPNNLAFIYPPDSGVSHLRELKDICSGEDFLNLDISPNTSLDVSIGQNASSVTLPSNLGRVNHSKPNSYQQKQVQRSSVPLRTSTPKMNQVPRPSVNTNQGRQLYQNLPGRQIPSTSSCNKPATPNSRTPLPSNQHIGSMLNSSCSTSITGFNTSHLPDQSIDGEDLSTTVNSLLEGIDTDSIFGDF
uniref:Uncharacterized protein C17orf53 n=2 Tax=Cacopsylla melanoneura TaxID=428564 RepID=A0A8D8RZL9_9HEMI